jgi:hypothetical protein
VAPEDTFDGMGKTFKFLIFVWLGALTISASTYANESDCQKKEGPQDGIPKEYYVEKCLGEVAFAKKTIQKSGRPFS